MSVSVSLHFGNNILYEESFQSMTFMTYGHLYLVRSGHYQVQSLYHIPYVLPFLISSSATMNSLRNRVPKVAPMQRVPECNLESSSSHSFPEISNTEQTNHNDDENFANGEPSNNAEKEELEEHGHEKEQDIQMNLPPYRSLEELAHIPGFSSGRSTSITSAGASSRCSMPSLSSIVEQDLTSVGTASVAESTTSSVNEPRFIQLKLTPPAEDAFLDCQRMVCSDPARVVVAPTPVATPPPPLPPLLRKEWKHLEGTTLDVLEAIIEKKNDMTARCISRWQSGNADVAPLTHAQKLLLPRRGDMQPRTVTRQASDVSTAPAMA